MKRYLPYLPHVIGYVMILAVNTAQLVSLYSGLIGEEGTGLSPWFSLAALDLSILLLSFRKPEWGSWNPARVLAVIVGILDFWFLAKRINAPIFSNEWVEWAVPALLFSFFFAGGIYYMSEELAKIHEEQTNSIEEARRKVEAEDKIREVWEEEVRSKLEADLSEREEAVKSREDSVKTDQRNLAGRIREWQEEVDVWEAKEKALQKPIQYGNSKVVVYWEDGNPKLKKA